MPVMDPQVQHQHILLVSLLFSWKDKEGRCLRTIQPSSLMDELKSAHAGS